MDGKKRKVTIQPWDYECGDGCCYDYGNKVFIDGAQLFLPNSGDDYNPPQAVDICEHEIHNLTAILEALGIEIEVLPIDDD